MEIILELLAEIFGGFIEDRKWRNLSLKGRVVFVTVIMIFVILITIGIRNLFLK